MLLTTILLLCFLYTSSFLQHGIGPRVQLLYPLVNVGALRCKDQMAIADEIDGAQWTQEFIRTQFLKDYWQQKPLFIRNAIDVATIKVEGHDLEKLSLEEDVESRVIRLTERKIEKEYGPFEEDLYKDLRKSQKEEPWTVFVQEIDRHIPEVADIWQKYFDFIPSWRRDDIMISYATKDAGIGAHCDDYDVFLIQGRGMREWSIENSFISPSAETLRLVSGSDTKILKDFTPDQHWNLQPGDMLYLPPRVPHRGISLNDKCLTISIGFRAPALRSAITAFVHHVCQTRVGEKELYADPREDLKHPQNSSGFISTNARRSMQKSLRDILTAAIHDDQYFDEWLGSYLTIPLRMSLSAPSSFFLEDSPGNQDYKDANDFDEFDEDLPIAVRDKNYKVASMRMFEDTESVLRGFMERKIALRRAEGVKMAYAERNLFIDGEVFYLAENWGSLICDNRVLEYDDLFQQKMEQSSAFVRFFSSLVRSGYFYPVDVL